MLQLARSLQSRPADVVSIILLGFSRQQLVSSVQQLVFQLQCTIAACFQRSAALLGVLAFMAAAVHACICCLLAFMAAAVHACICCLLAFMAAAVHACICCLLAFMAAAVHACICCLLAFMAAAVHACICCLLLPEASHLWCFICLWIDIDYSKFQPRSVSHRKAVRRAHHRHCLVLQTIFL